MRSGKIARGAEYEMEKQLQNMLFFGILIVFQIKIMLKIY